MGYFPGVGAFEQLFGPGGRNLNTNFPKIQMPGVLPWGGMLKLQFEWYIISIQTVFLGIGSPHT